MLQKFVRAVLNENFLKISSYLYGLKSNEMCDMHKMLSDLMNFACNQQKHTFLRIKWRGIDNELGSNLGQARRSNLAIKAGPSQI